MINNWLLFEVPYGRRISVQAHSIQAVIEAQVEEDRCELVLIGETIELSMTYADVMELIQAREQAYYSMGTSTGE